MIIQKLGKETDRYVDFFLDKNTITFADQLTIDLEAEEKDDGVNIPICSNGIDYHRTLHNDCAYVAQIIIPPRRYSIDYEEVDNEETGEVDLKETSTPIAFDVENVTLELWPILLAVNSEGDQIIDN
jgi:hypothetical protein